MRFRRFIYSEEYEAYYRAVPRLLPTPHGYPKRQDIMHLR
jgi:hypothetical protein